MTPTNRVVHGKFLTDVRPGTRASTAVCGADGDPGLARLDEMCGSVGTSVTPVSCIGEDIRERERRRHIGMRIPGKVLEDIPEGDNPNDYESYYSSGSESTVSTNVGWWIGCDFDKSVKN